MFKRIKLLDDIGLSAVQVGVPVRLLIFTIVNKEEELKYLTRENFKVAVNPILLAYNEETIKMSEGCLSIPNIYANIVRPKFIEISFENEYGVQEKMELDGISSRIFQHKFDHLNGKLFIDHLSAQKRSMVMSKYGKKITRK